MTLMFRSRPPSSRQEAAGGKTLFRPARPGPSEHRLIAPGQRARGFTVFRFLIGSARMTMGCAMYEHRVEQPRERFMEAAQKEMIAFELKEREFSRSLKKDRAEELHMPALKN
jgi:hypothetical protein